MLGFLKTAGRRGIFYIRQGYGLASMPFSFLGYASAIYYLAVVNQELILLIFPTFESFLLIGGISLAITWGTIGYIYMKRSFLYSEAQTIHVEANPYFQKKVVPSFIPFIEAMNNLCKEHGIETEELEQLIINSKGG